VAGRTLGLAGETDGMLYGLGDDHGGRGLCRDSSMAHTGQAAEGCLRASWPESEVRSAALGSYDRPRAWLNARENDARRETTRRQ
jgi:hypothetical protein